MNRAPRVLTNYSDVQVYENASLDRSFVILGKVHAKSGSHKTLLKKIKRLAKKNGGNAVLKYKITTQGGVSWWTGSQISYAEGIVVRFQDGGITEIKDSTPVTVLE